jgi:hypothetical protein
MLAEQIDPIFYAFGAEDYPRFSRFGWGVGLAEDREEPNLEPSLHIEIPKGHHMKKPLTLSIIALSVGAFAAPAMADAVVVSPNGVGIDSRHHDHDRHLGDRNIHRTRDHGDEVSDHGHHADRGE